MSVFYDLASLVLVPSGYKAQKVYAQKPLTADGQLTFSRASTATRVNASGLIETVSSNVPRLDYLGSTCPKLLLEPQRTNSLIYSEQFDNAAWAATRATITANATTAPDGNTSADLYTDGTFTGSTSFVEEVVVVGGSGTTYSVFVKKGTAEFVQFGFYDTDFHGFTVNTTTWASTNTFGSATGFSATNYGNGWYRLTMYKAASTNAIFVSIAVQANSTGTNYNGTGALTAYFWGAQVEAGNSNYATSYIPTEGTAVTRLADYPVNLPTAISLSGDFCLFWEGTALETDVMLYGSGNSTWYVNILGSAGRVILDTTTGRKLQGTTASLVVGTKAKILVRRQSGAHNVFVNGVKLTSEVSVNDTTTLSLSSMFWSYSSTFYKGQTINQSLIFKTALTDAQCIEITTL